MNEHAVLFVVYAVAAALQGVTGFGFAVLSVPIISLLYDPATAVAMNMVVGTSSFTHKALLLRRRTDFRRVGSFFAASLIGVPVGVWLLGTLPREYALTVMGLFLVAVGIANMRSMNTVSSLLGSRAAFWGFSALSGMLAGAFGAPGPAAVPYLLTAEPDTVTGQANLQWYFVLVSVPVIVLHILVGNVEPAALLRGLLYIPPVFAVTLVGNAFALRTTTTVLRTIINIALIAMGVFLAISAGG